ncbi:50S ribosomal protein L18 [Candidatus Micrarchaeota archaeon]|nr:50S ribosomal protein L18 [Candidatus Micrarchaeota archaeon]
MTRARGPKYIIHFKRRRKNLTDYKKRLALLKSGRPRLVVRKTNNRIIAQIIKYVKVGDKVIVSTDSTKLRKYGWFDKPNIPTAYLTGYLCGKESLKKNVKSFVLDIGIARPTKGNLLFAVMKGAVDAGLETNYDDKIIAQERLNGLHIAEYAKKLKSDEQKYKRQFSGYIKQGITPEDIPDLFEKVKSKIV